MPPERAVTAAGDACLVTGASGFLGAAVSEALIAAGRPVVGLDANAPSPRLQGVVGYRHICGELTDSVDTALFEGVGRVLHLASRSLPSSDADVSEEVDRSVLATVRLAETAARTGVGAFVFASSGGAVYGAARTIPTPEDAPLRPVTGYGAGKAAIEALLGAIEHRTGMRCLSLRTANAYGPHQMATGVQGVVAAFIDKALRGEDIRIWGDGSVERDFVHVDDVAAAFTAAVGYAGGERVFNVGSGASRRIGEVAREVVQACGSPSRVLLGERRDIDVPVSRLDISRSRRELGWEPRREWTAGLAQTVRWWREAQPGGGA